MQPWCCFSVKTDFNSDPHYVFKAVLQPSNRVVAASTSSGLIKLYDAQAGTQLNHVGDLRGHTDTITDVAFAAADSPGLVHSSSTDGTVRGWDMRAGQEVRFHPSTRCVASGSIDGLVAVHDTCKPLTNDEAFVAAINVGTSVEELGMYGARDERLWVRTGTETLHLWEWGRAVTESAEGGEGAFAEFLEARDTATGAAAAAAAAASAAAGGASPSPADGGAGGCTNPSLSPSNAFRHGVEYLVGCHYDAPSQQLMLVAGRDGTVGFWPLLEQQAAGGGALVGAEVQPPVMALQGAHSGVVRSVQCYDSQQGPAFCITGGEDAQICLWSLNPNTPRTPGAGSLNRKGVALEGGEGEGQRRAHRRGGARGKGGKGEGPGPVTDKNSDKGPPKRMSPY
ncbi:WD40-repeat-containing domain protein [Dunaliella salina]|uniref:WD40-repeat-containing domain protein n=1 Tax=Dunaliella salina TaxID=3046 RepID=A0ABQ7GSF7_DUNSA|nr:WD40-repeat-containing domain protein [Dunaliella salina]|eukprot:KAF5837535.1 WD40-repeat-containing domain protein [Dunaliella salina]